MQLFILLSKTLFCQKIINQSTYKNIFNPFLFCTTQSICNIGYVSYFRQILNYMYKQYLQFFMRLLILSAIVGMITFFYFTNNPENYFPFFPYMFLVFMILPVLIFIFLVQKSNDMKKFPNLYMITLMIKFFLYAGMALYYILSIGKMITPFLISFFILYTIFQIFETKTILKFIKNKK